LLFAYFAQHFIAIPNSAYKFVAITVYPPIQAFLFGDPTIVMMISVQTPFNTPGASWAQQPNVAGANHPQQPTAQAQATRWLLAGVASFISTIYKPLQPHDAYAFSALATTGPPAGSSTKANACA
jgi:hypothetical protein